jgi:hypothetical protein
MQTAIEVPAGTGGRSPTRQRSLSRRRSLTRRRRVALLLGATTCLLARSAAGSIPAATPGERTCRDIPGATAAQYATGVACPPEGFAGRIGYAPVLVETPAGWRFTRPASADGGCSGPLPDTGPFWDFGEICRAHDYGYDLVRFGVGDRAAADELLYRDMKRACVTNGLLGRPACKALADSAHAVLWAGDVAPGFEPTPERGA